MSLAGGRSAAELGTGEEGRGGCRQKVLLKAQVPHQATSVALGCLLSAEETDELAFMLRF